MIKARFVGLLAEMPNDRYKNGTWDHASGLEVAYEGTDGSLEWNAPFESELPEYDLSEARYYFSVDLDEYFRKEMHIEEALELACADYLRIKEVSA